MGKLIGPCSMAVIVVVTLAVAGCGTGGGGTVKAVTAADAPALAGVWQGYMLSTQGTSYPATLTVKPDGTYVVQGGALRGEGRAEPRDGHVQFVSTSTTGGMSVGER